jgi:hypothetical protein
MKRFWDKVRMGLPDECWEWRASTNSYGYGKFGIVGRVLGAHRIAWELSHGPVPEGQCVLHRCDNPPCCNPAHLFLGTQADNMRDCKAKGRNPHGERHGSHLHPERRARGERSGAYTMPDRRVRGEANGQSKIEADDVCAILALWHGGMLQGDIGERFGICQQEVSNIVSGKAWRHVTAGRMDRPRQVRVTNSSLQPWQIPYIRMLLASGVSQGMVARAYGVGQPAISKAALGQTWGHIPALHPSEEGLADE